MTHADSHSDVLWRAAPYSWAEAESLSRELGLPFVVATVLASRGYGDPATARAFLDCSNEVPDPFLFADMAQAVELILATSERGARVVVHGDYDADGITATALMVSGLRELGLEVDSYLPNRFTEGFGLSRSAVDNIVATGAGLLITVDCGVNYPEEVAYAREMGMDVIVVDHHEPGVCLPDCLVIHSSVGTYPNDHLCGVGLAFKVLHALNARINDCPTESVPERLHKYLDLVATGTIADLAPLVGENRYYVKEGLKLVAIGARTGFRELAKVAGCTGGVDSGSVAYRIAPRLNAAGRLADPAPTLDLLLTEDEKVAAEVSRNLHDLNSERQEVEKRILREAVALVEDMAELPPILVLCGHEWHEGVVGIVASRIVERYARPAVLLSVRDGVAKGSGRSIRAYDLVSGLNACAAWLTVYGGHTMAVGLTLPTESVEGFREAIETHAGGILTASDLLPTYKADAILRGEDINADTALALASLGPFGTGNPRPRLLALGASLRQPEVTRTGGHLRCTVDVDGVRAKAIGFGLGDRLPELVGSDGARALGVELRPNEWQGSVRPELLLHAVGTPIVRTEHQIACARDCAVRAKCSGAGDGGHVDSVKAGSAVPKKGAVSGVGDSGGAVGQILATGETVLLLTCSVPHSSTDLASRLPLDALVPAGIGCVSKGCPQDGHVDASLRAVVLAEWDVAIKDATVVAAGKWVHVVALDPPYRLAHANLLRRLEEGGARIHRLYGEQERERTAKLLRYLVHPRFAMVCVYRALARGATAEEVQQEAADLAWAERGVLLSDEDLSRALAVLAELGLERPVEGTARMEASVVPLYADAEADFEECSRLCRTL